jgi:4-amino-4-deoxy-L-arabinose transferase-like glycosyltransferase
MMVRQGEDVSNSSPFRREWVLTAGALLIILAGVVMRLIALGDHPYGLYQDEAFNGLDALRVLDGARPLYFPANNGREPFFIYLMAVTVVVFGRTALGVRAAAAVLGILTLPAMYLLGRTWGSRRVGLIGAAILSAMLWHVHLSRVGFRSVAPPLFMALALGLGAVGLNKRSQWALIGAGAAYGLGFYTYLAVRFTPLALVLMLVYGLVWHRDWLRDRWQSLLWMGGAAMVVVLPLAVLLVTQPDLVLGRSGQVAIWNEVVHRGDPVGTAIQSTVRTLGMFTWRGDWIWRHNVPNRPVFDPLLSLVFLGGLVLAVTGWRKRPALVLSLIWVGVMMLPTLLADDAPHFLRGSGVLPVVALIPALGVEESLRFVERRAHASADRRSVPLQAVIVGILALSAGLTARDYFCCRNKPFIPLSGYNYVGCYRTDPVRGYFFQAEATDLANDIHAAKETVYLDRRLWDTFPSVRFLTPDGEQLRLFDAGDPLGEAAPPFSLIAWPHGDLGPLLETIPEDSLITVLPGPETRGDSEPGVYRLYVRWDVESVSSMELSEPLARFENGMTLLDAQIREENGYLVATLWWQAEALTGESGQLFVHLVGEDGTTILDQYDGPVGTIYYPPLSWKQGSVIIHSITLEAVQSSTWLRVGLYDPYSRDRLGIVDTAASIHASTQDRAITLPLPGRSGDRQSSR